MRATAKITSGGRVTIPAEIRRRFNLTPGAKLVFVEKDGELSVAAEQDAGSKFDKYRGWGNPGLPKGRKGIVRYFRALRGHDDLDEDEEQQN